MGVTSNYSFPVPVATDLVKDGWDAINDLGVAVDTAMNTALGTKKAGMVLLNTTSFSGVASQALPASTFTSTYDNYKIILKLTATTADGNIFAKFRVSGVDASTNYYYATYGITSAGTLDNRSDNTPTTNFFVATQDTGSSAKPTYVVLDIFNVFAAQPTSVLMNSMLSNTAGTPLFITGGALHTTSTSYDSLNVIPASGNFSGSMTVYGWNI